MTPKTTIAAACLMIIAGCCDAFTIAPNSVKISLPMHRHLASKSQLFCETNDHRHSATPSQPIWTHRRGMLATSATTVASLVSLTLPNAVTAAESSIGNASRKNQFMADTSNILSNDTRQTLLRQSAKAFSQVTQANIDEYAKIGVTRVQNAIPKQWLDLLRDGCELAQDEAGPYGEYLNQPTDTGIFFTDLEMARRLPLFASFCLYGPAAAIAGTVMGSTEVRYLYDQLFVKERGVSTLTPWHQDGGYWRVKGDQVTSVFVPLDPVKPSDGLQFVSGSHKWPLHNPQHFADGTQYIGTSLPPMPDINAMIQQNDVDLASFSLEPGDVLVFSAKTVHGGPGNWGRALSTRWVGDDARFWNRPGEGAIPTIDVDLNDGDKLAANPDAFPTSWQQRTSI